MIELLKNYEHNFSGRSSSRKYLKAKKKIFDEKFEFLLKLNPRKIVFILGLTIGRIFFGNI